MIASQGWTFLPATGNKVYAFALTWFPFEQHYQGWYVVNNSVSGANFVVEGCYPTYNMVDGQKKYWSSQYAPSEYTAICMLSMDTLAGWKVNEDRGKIYSRNYTSSGGVRLPAVFGYDNVKHVWYFFGFMGPGAYSSDKIPQVWRRRTRLYSILRSGILTGLKNSMGCTLRHLQITGRNIIVRQIKLFLKRR